MPQMDIDPSRRCVADLTEIAKNMDSREAMSLIGKEAFFDFTVFASEDTVPDEMLKEIFFTDCISDDFYHVCITWENNPTYIDIHTMEDPDTETMCLRNILEYFDKDDVLIATPRSNYVLVACACEFMCEEAISLYV